MGNRKMDVLIVKPGNQKQVYGVLSSFRLTAIEPPLWAALLAGYLEGLGYSVSVTDAEVDDLSYEETAMRIQKDHPVLAVICVSGTNPSASTMNMTGAGILLRKLKQIAPDIKTLLHGLHPSALPERTLKEERVDFVCQGEGFYTLPPLIEVLKKGNRGPEEFSIPGLWFKKGTKIFFERLAPLYKDLNALPRPAWHLFPMKKYRAHNWHCLADIHHRQPYGVIYTSLGCPFHCSFCCIHALFGKPGIRYRSAQKVIEEIDFLVKTFNIRHFKIADELFTLDERHVTEICNSIIDRKYDLNIWAYARPDTVTSRMLKKMKKAGIHWLAYGFESANQKVLDNVHKYRTVEKIMDTIKKTDDEGIHVLANFMFGLPGDDFHSMQETLCLALTINAPWANFYATMAYPGSKLYQDAIVRGTPLPQTWAAYSPYSDAALPLPTRYLSAADVLNFRDYAFHTYFTNPFYLSKIKPWFGNDAVTHVRSMTKHKLIRKNMNG